MERCVFKHIHNYLLENNIIINNQSGFTKGDSAIYQLINITNEFGKALVRKLGSYFAILVRHLIGFVIGVY